MSDLPDTIPAPPVPSINPTAELRRELEESSVAVRRSGFMGDDVLIGMRRAPGTIGLYEDVTPSLSTAAAIEWLRVARLSVTQGTMFPEFCVKGHLKETVGICGRCLKGGG
jgi:hypothetical protein